MWTTRRIGLLLLGLAIAGAAFAGYSFVLGGFDGLPAIPQAYLKPATGTVIPQYPVSLTIAQLQQAFGPYSSEGGTDLDYKNRLQIPGHDGVIACGSPVPNGTPLVTVAPISVALFGKSALRPRPGTAPEISTFHADRAVLRFDRPVSKIDEMNTSKIVGIELASDPDDDPNTPIERKDKRKGRIWISQNRKSLDPADHIVVRTPGPVFVQLPDDDTPYDPNVPHVWTSAVVEVFDRQNLPQKLRTRERSLIEKYGTPSSPSSSVREITENIPPVAALARADDLRKYGAVTDILTGATLPPPTVVANGLKVFLKPEKKDPVAPKRSEQRVASFSGVREVLLCEQVQMNLWADGTGGFPGADSTPEKKTGASPNADPPLSAAALTGGLLDAGTLISRLDNRSLMLIETPGSFRYNFDAAVATFDISPQVQPGQQNFVVVTRLSAKNLTDDCVCSKLILEMETGKTDTVPQPERPTEDGFAVRTITALGPQVYLSAQAEGLEASGTELKYARDPSGKRTVTTLRGTPAAPVVAKRDGSKLTAGDPVANATVEIVNTETVVQGKPQKSSVVSVLGPGRLELVDKGAEAGEKRSGIAQWGRWLKHEKEVQAGRTLDLLKFEESASFVDPLSGFSLKSNSIWLWVANDPKASDRKPTAGKSAPIGGVPERLVADGDVHVDSEEMVVRKTNKLTVWFRDVAPPKPAKMDAPPVVTKVDPLKPNGGQDAPLPAIPPVPGEQPKVAQAPPKEAEKKPIPNPIQLQADTIESWVVRYPLPPLNETAKKNPDSPTLKYELERARCDDNVYVHQDPDPNDLNRPKNGIDIQGNKLTLDHSPPAGSVLTVIGGRNKDNYAAVQFDGTTIYGQTVVIDQPNNAVSVDGRGRLKTLSASDISGNEVSNPTDLQVDWATKMRFEGAKAFAQFVGGVVVDQVVKPDPPGKPAPPRSPSETLPAPRNVGPINTTTNQTNLWCHQLDLTFDRPIYFNQLRSQDRNQPAKDGTKTAERPKLKKLFALPFDDPAAQPLEKLVVFRELAQEKDGSLARGRLLTAKQMDFDNRTKEQELYAVGPGELRILQPESEDANRQPADPNARTSAKPPAQDKGEMKLTVVTFRDKMTGTDTGNGAFQKADFPNGAVVMNTPATNLMLALEPHALPKGSVYLTCQDRMTVSSRKTKKDAPAEQWLDAFGNAEFKDDTRTGLGDKIRYDGIRAVLNGTEKRLATLMSNKKGVTNEQSLRAMKFVYNSKTGQVELSDTAGGAFSTGR